MSTLNWGILGPGRIANVLISDVLTSQDPRREKTADGEYVKHKVVAVASNSSIKNAQTFKEDVLGSYGADCKIYGKYQDLLDDETVAIDIVYIATPNLNHYELCYKALKAGKNVFMEKPFCINAKQTEALIKYAKTKKLFLMEALWLRFNPLVTELRKGKHLELIGDLKRVRSDLSFEFDQSNPLANRIYEMDLGGGLLLDLGVYSLTWILEFLQGKSTELPDIQASAIMASTGVDVSTGILLNYGDRLGMASCSGHFYSSKNDKSVMLEGTKGRIEIDQACAPTYFKVYDAKGDLIDSYSIDAPHRTPLKNDFIFEADHVARCLAKGLLESDVHSLQDTLTLSKIMDKVREQIGLQYPEALETLEL